MNNTRPVDISGVIPGGRATGVLQDDEQEIPRLAMCPMCHTSASVTQRAVDAGADWRCVRCGQHWDGGRLATVAEYAEWAGDRDRSGVRATHDDHVAAISGNAPIQRTGGKP